MGVGALAAALPVTAIRGYRAGGMTDVTPHGWKTSQRRAADGAVESQQHVFPPDRVVEADDAGALRLGRIYWQEVEGFTRGIVRTVETAEGMELRVAGGGPAVLRFGRPTLRAQGATVSATYPILGGMLARRPGGTISFAQSEEPRVELASAIEGFFPTLAARPGAPAWTGELYRQVQARIHVRISRRYFGRLIREAGL
jgi:hypothetical protein